MLKWDDGNHPDAGSPPRTSTPHTSRAPQSAVRDAPSPPDPVEGPLLDGGTPFLVPRSDRVYNESA
jgi:hypothetical protein